MFSALPDAKGKVEPSPILQTGTRAGTVAFLAPFLIGGLVLWNVSG